jgi:hypothetical protein
MTRTQKIFKSLLPASWAASMENESRQWLMRCETCNFEKSVWDFGGIRWKAAGNPRRKVLCGACQNLSWHATYKKFGVVGK